MRTWDTTTFPSLYRGEYIFDYIEVNPWTFAPMSWRAGADAIAGVGAHRHAELECGRRELDRAMHESGALLRAEFRQSRIASRQQRLCGVLAGYGAADKAAFRKPGCALRLANVCAGGQGGQSAVAVGGVDAGAGQEFCASNRICICDRRPAADHGARGIRCFLRADSADVSVRRDQ